MSACLYLFHFFNAKVTYHAVVVYNGIWASTRTCRTSLPSLLSAFPPQPPPLVDANMVKPSSKSVQMVVEANDDLFLLNLPEDSGNGEGGGNGQGSGDGNGVEAVGKSPISEENQEGRGQQGFEGPEKTLEIEFDPDVGHEDGLRAIRREQWDAILQQVNNLRRLLTLLQGWCS